MKSPISDKIKSGGIKKQKMRSPLSGKYKQFLNHENINLEKVKKELPNKLEDIKINVIKKDVPNEGKSPKKEGTIVG